MSENAPEATIVPQPSQPGARVDVEKYATQIAQLMDSDDTQGANEKLRECARQLNNVDEFKSLIFSIERKESNSVGADLTLVDENGNPVAEDKAFDFMISAKPAASQPESTSPVAPAPEATPSAAPETPAMTPGIPGGTTPEAIPSAPAPEGTPSPTPEATPSPAPETPGIPGGTTPEVIPSAPAAEGTAQSPTAAAPIDKEEAAKEFQALTQNDSALLRKVVEMQNKAKPDYAEQQAVLAAVDETLSSAPILQTILTKYPEAKDKGVTAQQLKDLASDNSNTLTEPQRQSMNLISEKFAVLSPDDGFLTSEEIKTFVMSAFDLKQESLKTAAEDKSNGLSDDERRALSYFYQNFKVLSPDDDVLTVSELSKFEKDYTMSPQPASP